MGGHREPGAAAIGLSVLQGPEWSGSTVEEGNVMETTEIRAGERPQKSVAAYEPPTITDAGDFTEQTRGEFGDWPDFPVGLWL